MNKAYKARIRAYTDRPAALLEALGLTPTAVTLLGAGVAIVNAVVFAVVQELGLFVLIYTLCGWLDSLDGALARRTGKTTLFGAYLDAVLDRIVDGICVLAIAYVTGDWIVVTLGILWGNTVSYSKARAGMEVPLENGAMPVLMERAERGVMLAFGLGLHYVLEGPLLWGQSAFFWWVVLMNALILDSIVRRVLMAKALMEGATATSGAGLGSARAEESA